MATLTLSHCKFAVISPIQSPMHSLTLIDIGLAGGFGAIYKTVINGTEYAVKVFHPQSAKRGYETTNQLIDKIDASSHTVEGLKALPLFSFEGRLNNKPVQGYVTYYFDPNRYISLEEIIANKIGDYAKITLDNRLLLVKQLCEALQKLESFSFIHADINGQNILIDLHRLHLILIDFDSGAVTNSDNDIPATWGKLNEWVAPEIREQIIRKSPSIKITIHTDRFAALVGVHYLIFMQPPFCFLTTMSHGVMQSYLTRYG